MSSFNTIYLVIFHLVATSSEVASASSFLEYWQTVQKNQPELQALESEAEAADMRRAASQSKLFPRITMDNSYSAGG